MSVTPQNMLLVSSSWRNQRTFKLIPLDKECPFIECIFDPSTTSLAVVSKEKKENYHMLPKVSDNGDIVKAKRRREDGKPYDEQRVLLDTYYEYYIEEKDEITNFVTRFAVNGNEYDFKTVLDAAFKTEEKEEEIPLQAGR